MSIKVTDKQILILAAPLVVGLILEALIPLRESRQPKPERVVRNIGIALIASVAMRFLFFPFVASASNTATREKIGLLSQIIWPSNLLRTLVSIVLLDYTLYVWHLLNHKISFLWRFHNPHHIDLDLDVSTASRFHFGELFFSSFFRIGQIFLFGINFPTLLLYEMLTTAFAQFHHSNIKLPVKLERALNLIFVTPRMHGIHHSIVRNETDSNYGTIFSFWDRIHHSLKLGVKQSDIVIGVPAFQKPDDVNFLNTLVSPFRKPRNWRLDSGDVPSRERELAKNTIAE